MTNEEDDQEKHSDSQNVSSCTKEKAQWSSRDVDAEMGLLGVDRFLNSDARQIRVVSLESLKVKS